LQQARRATIADASANSQLARLLEDCDRTTDHRVIAGLLDVVRSQGEHTRELAGIVSRFLPHQADIYQGRDKWHVLRLRAYTFLTLSEIGFPDSAMPMLVDALAYVDERMSAVEVGAATRVVSTLGQRGRRFIPYLVSILGERFAEEELSLDRYETEFPRAEATTVQLEVMRSLAAVSTAEDDEALSVLRAIAGSHAHSTLDPRLVQEAKSALQIIETRSGSGNWFEWIRQWIRRASGTDNQYATPWLEPTERHRLQNLDIALVDHDGRKHVLSQLIDRPVLLTFFYTRCQNAGKCSTTISSLAVLQQELTLRGMASNVRLLAITFEPEFDTSERLHRYAVDRGMVLGDQAHAVRLDSEDHAAFMEELDTPVGYSSGWVNTHGIEAVLLDAEGRLARKYRILGWDGSVVLDDFQRLLAGQ
jgi:protein SCO1/2